jgi:translation elongation factor EF-Ts
MEDT